MVANLDFQFHIAVMMPRDAVGTINPHGLVVLQGYDDSGISFWGGKHCRQGIGSIARNMSFPGHVVAVHRLAKLENQEICLSLSHNGCCRSTRSRNAGNWSCRRISLNRRVRRCRSLRRSHRGCGRGRSNGINKNRTSRLWQSGNRIVEDGIGNQVEPSRQGMETIEFLLKGLVYGRNARHLRLTPQVQGLRMHNVVPG